MSLVPTLGDWRGGRNQLLIIMGAVPTAASVERRCPTEEAGSAERLVAGGMRACMSAAWQAMSYLDVRVTEKEVCQW